MPGSYVYSDTRLVIARTGIPGALSMLGAIDQFNAEAVAWALHAELEIAADGADEPCSQLCIDLSCVEFVDTGGIRAFVQVAERAGHEQRLVLQGLPPLIRTVMLVVGWGNLPGLVIEQNPSISNLSQELTS